MKHEAFDHPCPLLHLIKEGVLIVFHAASTFLGSGGKVADVIELAPSVGLGEEFLSLLLSLRKQNLIVLGFLLREDGEALNFQTVLEVPGG